jgi:hypothetical protein
VRFAIGFILGVAVGYPTALFTWMSIVMPDSHGGGGHGAAAIAGPSVAMAGLFVVAPVVAVIAGLLAGYLFRSLKLR